MTLTKMSKLQATGNDFIVVFEEELLADGVMDRANEPVSVRTTRALCDRHLGIGADGIIIIHPGVHDADCQMEYRNSDGSPAEMTGNGIRCLAWIAARAGLGSGDTLVVDTDAGRRQLHLERDAYSNEVQSVTVDMGSPSFDPRAIGLHAPSPFGLQTDVNGHHYEGDAVSIGNPHWVLFLKDPISRASVLEDGAALEQDSFFEAGTNVEFVIVENRNEMSMQVWERGVGVTLSCGTGAVAAVAAAHVRGVVDQEVIVHVPGGALQVEVGETIKLTGPVQHVFDIEIDLHSFAV